MSETIKPVWKTTDVAIDEEKQLLRDINAGLIVPVKTSFECMNNSLLGGFMKSDIALIGGLSSTGKSVFVGELEDSVIDLNPNVRVLTFTFEMVARKLISRKYSKTHRVSMHDIYTTKIDIEKYEVLRARGKRIDYVEDILDIYQIEGQIYLYCNKYPNDQIIIIIDHTLLTKNLRNQSETESLVALGAMMNKLKKILPISFVVVSQLNNSMLEVNRLRLPSTQYPNQTDIFGSKQLYHVADFVGILVAPIKLNLPGKEYGVHRLPLSFTNANVTYNAIYFHRIKVREGAPGINCLLDDLKYNTFKEVKGNAHKKLQDAYGI